MLQPAIDGLPAASPFRYPRLPLEAPPAARAPAPPAAPPPSPATAGTPASEKGAFPAPWSWCRVLGTVAGRYVALETDEGLVLMDPHAAHERVLFERFLKDVQTNAIASQTLLMPETVDLGPKDAARVRSQLGLLKRMGFGVSEFGGDHFVVDALPAHFGAAAPAALLVEIAAALEQGGSRGKGERWREELVAQAASRAAVRGRARLALPEIEQLVVDLAGTDMPYTCPHGRPTVIFHSLAELNRKFGRA
jgi:DNA mismatch repair protein MutL